MIVHSFTIVMAANRTQDRAVTCGILRLAHFPLASDAHKLINKYWSLVTLLTAYPLYDIAADPFYATVRDIVGNSYFQLFSSLSERVDDANTIVKIPGNTLSAFQTTCPLLEPVITGMRDPRNRFDFSYIPWRGRFLKRAT